MLCPMIMKCIMEKLNIFFSPFVDSLMHLIAYCVSDMVQGTQ